MSETYDLGTTRLRIVTATEAATVIEAELDPGGGSASHVHTREDETIVVVEGALSVDAAERVELGPGDAVVIPRAQRHQFVNASDAPTRLYFVCTPGGLERFFRDLAAGVEPEQAAERAGLEFG